MEQDSIQDLQAENEKLLREVQELRQSNKELLVCKQQLDALMDHAPVEVYLKDRDGRYLKINKEFEKIFGVRSEDLVGLLPEDVHDPELAASTRHHDLTVLNSGVAEHREEIARLVIDDQMHTLLTVKFPVFNDAGEVDGLGAIVTDITGRKQLEEHLRRAQKMEAVGQLTGGIAHDFNNLLGIIMGNLELLEPYTKHHPKAVFHIESALKGANRGAELTRKLLSFSRSSGSLAKRVSLNEFILGMESLIARSLTASVSLKMQLKEDLWSVRIDPGELEDAILNLSLNSRDAMPTGGEILIRTSNEVLAKDPVLEDLTAKTGEFVMFSLSDSGQGMTPEVRKKATEPFFTMKEANKGTGLGLSMVYGFVHRSGGHMEIISGPGEGTEVRLYLPRVHEKIPTESESINDLDAVGGHETILVVDDEKALVAIAVSHLETLGYATVTAHDSQQALEVLRSSAEIDLMFADVIMPGDMDGHELAIAARVLRPELKILMTSGFTRKFDDVVDGEGDSRLLASLLRKPYDKSGLSTAIRNALDGE